MLTSATGAGHDTHAQATVDWCARLFGNTVEVTVDHTLEDSHPFYRGGVDFYNYIQRRMPWLHHFYYNVVEFLELLNPGTVSLGRDYYIELVERTRPDAILSVHDCLNRGYFELARSLRGTGLKCATYCPEFCGGYGFSRNWVNPNGNFFFGRTEETAQVAYRRGMSTDQAISAGHWAPPAFYDPPLDATAKARFLETLRLDPARFTLLLSTGGNGAQNHASILRQLAPLGDRLQVIALCGRQEVPRLELEQWAERHMPFPVRALGFRNDMAQLFQVSSAVIARAGATTGGEALLCGCPVIFNGLGVIMPQEIPTWRYYKARHIGACAHTSGQFRSILQKWLDRPDEYAAMRERMQQVRDLTTPEPALRRLLGL